MGRTPQDRARILIDLLPTKSKDLDWYKSFRDALLNPDGSNNVKQRYKSLVEFLDNTMIHRPTSQAGKFSEVESRSKRYPRYPRSLLELPKTLRQELEEAGTPEAEEQLRKEQEALQYLRRLEVVGMGFRLADLLVVVEMWPQAEETLLAIINFLGSHTGLETWAKKAETLAVFAVQLAFEKFGKHHPLYLKALSSLCQFCNEFKQDGTGVQLAKELLDAAEKTYGCESLTLAAAHRTLSKALMVKQAFRTDDGYYTHAMEAVRIARSQLPHGHPMLHPYLTNFAMALQWKSLHCPKEVQDSTLRWAETEAQQALTIVIKHYGDISLRSAQIHTLLGQIYSKMNQ
nr:hypothetical protein BaRGS_020473 [Batillaria attramentaria]